MSLRKILPVSAVVLAATALILSTRGSAATGPAHLSFGAGSRVWFEGDSTLHRFKGEVAGLKESFTVHGASAKDIESMARSGSISGVEVTIPAARIVSGDLGLDKNMWKALKVDENPSIVFQMLSSTVVPPTEKDAELGLKLHGRLVIAGVGQDIDIDGQGFRTPAGMRVTGSKELLMSEYGIKPPVIMAGMIKVKDKIVVRFDILVENAGT